MLDVHPPHSPTHTWKDFFIHVGTICVGLLIAVGLEQTVEYFHHQHQVADTRHELTHERELNRKRFELLYENLDQFAQILRQQADLYTWIRQHPHATPNQWPPHPGFISFPGVPYSDAAWRTAQANGVLNFMPPREVKANNELYARLQQLNSQQDQLRAAVANLRGVAIDGPLQDLTPQQLDDAWKALKDVRIHSASVVSLQHGVVTRYPDFPDDTRFFGIRGLLLNEVHHSDDVDEWEKAMSRLNAIDAEDDKD